MHLLDNQHLGARITQTRVRPRRERSENSRFRAMAMPTTITSFLKRDPCELQLYSALKTAQQEVADWPGSLPVPVLCTVGMQSAGKTTFIEALVGFRVGTTCAGTGTRCPVRYILKDGEPFFSVSGKMLKERRDIQLAVERHMQSLSLKPKENERFSREELKVEITDHNLPSLDITDLPGLKAKGEGAEEIKEVVRFVVQSKSARPIVLVKATESVETQADVELLRDVGIDPKKGNATFVVNYFNDQLYKFSRVSELNEYCNGYVREYGCVYFCMLIYSQDAKDQKDRLDFDGQSSYYRELPVKEKETFDEKVALLTLDESLNDDWVVRRFGVAPAICKMQSIIRDFIVCEGRRYADKLKPLEEQKDAELRNVQKELKKCNPDYIKEQREKYVERWGDVVRDVQLNKKRLDDESDFKPMDCAMTFFEELEMVYDMNNEVTLLTRNEKPPIGNEKEQLSWAKRLLKKHQREPRQSGQSSDIPKLDDLDLGSKLTADASLVRVNDVFDFIISTQIGIEAVRENEARAMSGYAPGDMPGAFDNLQVVKEIATRPVAEVKSKIEPMLAHIEAIYKKALDFAHSTMMEHPGYTETLRTSVTESYCKFLKAKLIEAKKCFQRVIIEKTSYMPADFHERYAIVNTPEHWHGMAETCVRIFSYFLMGFSQTGLASKRGSILCVGLGVIVIECFPRLWHSRTTLAKIEDLNSAGGIYCQRLKKQLIQEFKSIIARSVFNYVKRDILVEVRDDLRQQIRDIDAKRIDEDTRQRAEDLKGKEKALQQSLKHIRRVLDGIESLDASHLQTSTEASSGQ